MGETEQGIKAARWARAKEIVADAVELPDGARNALVVSRCADDPLLLREVQSLLQYANDPSSVIDAPIHAGLNTRSHGTPGDADRRATPDRAGEMVGAWRLEREIGRGGMGVVFLAHRADGAYQQSAAVKLLRAGAGDARSAARMQRERQTLAQLTHPNIARLIDGGNASDGTPYLVMEYVDGESIDRYCESRKLSIRQRIELMLALCAAVQSAHQRLVIHRDLKPSNVLVTKDGVPKLLDFGVARLLESQGNEREYTQGALLFTPRYASPEQVRGLPVSVATDVYGVGLLLYELLAGESPYLQLSSNAATSAAAAMQAVMMDALRQPSEVARVHRRANAAALRGDLDTILQKACAKDTSQRYATVAELSADLSRYLHNRPILARAPTWSYVGSRFIRRHTVGVSLGLVALLAVAAGFTGTVMQKNRAEVERAKAEARYHQVRDLATRMVTDYNDAILRLPGGTEVRQRMANDAIRQLDTLARDAPNDPVLNAQIAQAYQKLAVVSFSDTRSHMGDGKTFDASLKKAEALINQAITESKTAAVVPIAQVVSKTPLSVTPPVTVDKEKDLRRELELQWGDTQKSLAARARATGEYDKAQSIWEGVVKHFAALAAVSPNDEQYLFYMLDSYYSLASQAITQQRVSARSTLDAAARETVNWLKLSPKKADIDYLAIREARAEYYQAKLEKNAELAISHISREIRIHEARATLKPANVEWISDHARVLKEKAGYQMQLGNFADALSAQTAALALITPIHEADTADVLAQSEVLWITRDRGISLTKLDRQDDAARAFETAFQMCTPMVDTDKTSLTIVRLCVNAAWWTTKARINLQRHNEANESAKRIVAIRDKFPQLFENKLEQLWLKNAREALAGEPLSAPNVGAPLTLPTLPGANGAAKGEAKAGVAGG